MKTLFFGLTLLGLASSCTINRISSPEIAEEIEKHKQPAEPMQPYKSTVKMNMSAFTRLSMQGDLEFFMNSGTSSIQLSPRGTMFSGWSGDVWGAGGDLSYRLYLPDALYRKPKSDGLFYFFLRGGYDYFETQNEDWWWGPGPNPDELNEQINRVKFEMGVGVQHIIKRMLAIDLNFGGGMRFAQTSIDNTWWDDWFGDFGYTGFAPSFQLSIGLVGGEKRR